MKMSNDEFIKFINSHGGAKDVLEAFKEYPPEEEWHKGKIENILKEDYEVYSLYSVGDIVFVNTYQNESIAFKIGSVDKEKVDEYIDCYIKSKENAK